MFLAPELANDAKFRVALNNPHSAPSCQVYQRGVIEGTTIDVGDHCERMLLMVPHASCPVLLSHASLLNTACCISNLVQVLGTRLVDPYPGLYGGSPPVVPPFRSHEFPGAVDLAAGASIGIPIHGGFYGPTSYIQSAALVNSTQLMYRQWTEAFVAGVAGGINVLPSLSTDTVSLVVLGRGVSTYVNGDLNLRVRTMNNAGIITTATVALGNGATGATLLLTAVYTIPVGAIGIVSCELSSAAAASRSYDFTIVKITHQVNTSNVDPSSFGGSFVGTPTSGFSSLLPICQSARVTALSVKVTNTSSALNANGYIVGTATVDTPPAATGIYGATSIATKTTSKSFPLVDGCYMALAPSTKLRFSPLDAAPPDDISFGVMAFTTQDATAITFKIEYHAVIEVISQDPLFAPGLHRRAKSQSAMLSAVQSSAGYLVLSENPLHWNDVQGALTQAAKFYDNKVSPVVKKIEQFVPAVRQARQIADLTSHAVKQLPRTQPKSKANKKK